MKKQEKPKKTGIFNPLPEDFTVYYDIRDSKDSGIFTAKKDKITFFEPHIAKHMKTHLIDHLLNLNWPKDGNVETAKKRFMEQISVEVEK